MPVANIVYTTSGQVWLWYIKKRMMNKTVPLSDPKIAYPPPILQNNFLKAIYMKINLAIIISVLVLLLGFFKDQPYLWIPMTVLIAGMVDLFTRRWVSSDKLGSAQSLSVILKFVFALIGFYAMIGQVVCIGLLIWWFAF